MVTRITLETKLHGYIKRTFWAKCKSYGSWERHNTKGPAIDWSNGQNYHCYYFLMGEFCSNKTFWEKNKKTLKWNEY